MSTPLGPASELILPNPDESDTEDMAVLLAPHLRSGDMLILSGELGAGKTFFSGALCRALGLSEDEHVTSPTFALVQEYATNPIVVHCDLYRLADPSEILELGLIEEREEGKKIFLIEWGERFLDYLGESALLLNFELWPRTIRISARGDRGRELLAAIERNVSQNALSR